MKDLFNLKNKVALVTGASSGMARQLPKQWVFMAQKSLFRATILRGWYDDK